MNIHQLHAMQGLDPAYVHNREAMVNRMADRLVRRLRPENDVADDDGDLPPPRQNTLAGGSGVDSGRSRQPVVINYTDEEQLDAAAVVYYALRDAEESHHRGWSIEGHAVPPTDATVLMALRERVIAFERDAQPCCICLNAMRQGTKAAWLPCGHHFCKPCVVAWLRASSVHPHCPICRNTVVIPPPTPQREPVVAPPPAQSGDVVRSTRRWERLMEEEEEAMREVTATATAQGLTAAGPPGGRPPSGQTSPSNPIESIVAEQASPSTSVSFDELERRSPWLKQYMEARRREDLLQRIKEGSKESPVPLPRVATLLPSKQAPPPVLSPKAPPAQPSLTTSPGRRRSSSLTPRLVSPAKLQGGETLKPTTLPALRRGSVGRR